ncbi:NUDIX domain-containing protein [Streptomyces sp. HUAS TT7]|uniref:NUDIX domain-containing protein n=1 Tax=Streptomyces sp. HUAS TT7 TaxID=3447507 RepID=UPI003F655F24
MSVRGDQIVKELAHYLHEHSAEAMALMPLYDAACDHAKRRACLHHGRCPLVMAGAVVVDQLNRVLSLRHQGGYSLAETAPEPQDDSLSGAAVRLLAEEVGIRDVWTEPGTEGPFLVDVTRAPREYGPRIRVGFRYLYRAHSGAVFPAVIESGAAAWVPIAEIGIPSVRERVQDHLIGAA